MKDLGYFTLMMNAFVYIASGTISDDSSRVLGQGARILDFARSSSLIGMNAAPTTTTTPPMKNGSTDGFRSVRTANCRNDSSFIVDCAPNDTPTQQRDSSSQKRTAQRADSPFGVTVPLSTRGTTNRPRRWNRGSRVGCGCLTVWDKNNIAGTRVLNGHRRIISNVL